MLEELWLQTQKLVGSNPGEYVERKNNNFSWDSQRYLQDFVEFRCRKTAGTLLSMYLK